MLYATRRKEYRVEHFQLEIAGRLPVLDNAKLILIACVVLFHFLGSACGVTWKLREARHIQLFIDPFETRAFCFISGILSPCRPSMKASRSLVLRVVAPTILYCAVIVPLLVLTKGKEQPDLNLLMMSLSNLYMKTNNTVIWYMQALFVWKLLGFLLVPLRTWIRLAAAVSLGMAGGYFDLTCFHLDRAVAYFPIFVLGQIFPLQRALALLAWNTRTALAGCCILTSVLLFTVLFEDFVNSLDVAGWHTRHHAFESEFRFYWFRGLFVNLFETSKALVLLLLVVPRKANFLTKYGENSLYAYLLHPFVITLFLDPVKFLHHPVPCWLELPFWCLLAAFSFGVAVALSSWPVRQVFKVILEPVWLADMIFKPETPQELAEKLQAPAPEKSFPCEPPSKFARRSDFRRATAEGRSWKQASNLPQARPGSLAVAGGTEGSGGSQRPAVKVPRLSLLALEEKGSRAQPGSTERHPLQEDTAPDEGSGGVRPPTFTAKA